jgi:hypothetical protein
VNGIESRISLFSYFIVHLEIVIREHKHMSKFVSLFCYVHKGSSRLDDPIY